MCVKVLGHPQPLFFKQSGGGVGMGVRSLPALICFCSCAPPATRSGHAGPGQTLPTPTGSQAGVWEEEAILGSTETSQRPCMPGGAWAGAPTLPQVSSSGSSPSPIFWVPPRRGSCGPRDGQTQARPRPGTPASARSLHLSFQDKAPQGQPKGTWGGGVQVGAGSTGGRAQVCSKHLFQCPF